ncbi:hypothetical protein V6N13_026634 [Hibiscus sabdariffa]
MEQARLDCYRFQDQLSMFHLLLCKCFDRLLKQDDKGDVSNRDNGSCPGRYLDWYSDFGRASCCFTGLSLSPVTICLVLHDIPRRKSCHLFVTAVTRILSSQGKLLLHLLSR